MRALLTARDRASLNAAYARSLTDSCAITSPALIDDPVKGEVRSWQTVAQTVPCARLSRKSALAQGYVIDDDATTGKAILMVARGTVVHADDRITVNGGGTVWEVAKEPQDPGTYGPAVYLECTEAGS
jgi:hypothetical protein